MALMLRVLWVDEEGMIMVRDARWRGEMRRQDWGIEKSMSAPLLGYLWRDQEYEGRQ